jgi:2-oxo-4-hydroxy-4-carboxy--5-ureidoimidazoline (OHCU) decarboxylase
VLAVLQQRIGRSSDDELQTALGELVQIAVDRWRRQ